MITRKNFLIGAAATAATASAIDGESIAGGFGRARGLLGGAFMGAMLAQQGKLTAKDYVQSGLVAMWDGRENAGFGVHNNSATKWTDLVGNVGFSLKSRASWSDSGLVFDNTSAIADRTIGFVSTLECVFEHSIVNNKVVVLNCESFGSGTGSCRGIFYNQNATEGLGYYFDGNVENSKILQTDGSKKSVAVTWAVGSHNSVSAERYLNSVRSTYDGAHSSGWGVTGYPYLCIGGRADHSTGEYTYGGSGVMYALRLYNRALTAAEIAHNYAVDKARFNLP